jgi:hypothetical protein
MLVLVEGIKGGSGSGNWGHAGRPGMVGGSGGRGVGVAKTQRMLQKYTYDNQKSAIKAMRGHEGVPSADAADAWRNKGPNINRRLRGGRGSRAANELEESMIPLRDDIVVFRGYRTQEVPQSGQTLKDAGLLSTSLDGSVAETAAIGEGFGSRSGIPVVLVMSVPKGVPATYLEKINPTEEYEVLFGRNSVVKVLDVVPPSTSYWWRGEPYKIYAEMSPARE